jgi:hypothetical protein
MNKINFNKDRKRIKSGQKLCQQNRQKFWQSVSNFLKFSFRRAYCPNETGLPDTPFDLYQTLVTCTNL